MLDTHSQAGWYRGVDAEGRLLPTSEFASSIERHCARTGQPFSRPAYWSNPVFRVRAFDAAPAEFSAQDSAALQELRHVLRRDRGERRRASDIERGAQETLDYANRIFPHTPADQEFLDRHSRIQRAKDSLPMSEWLQQSAAASCGFTLPAPRRAMDAAPGADANEKMQADYDAIRTGEHIGS